MDIVVTTPKYAVADAKREASDCLENGGGYYFRCFGKRKINISAGDRVWYVEDGYLRGFAVVAYVQNSPELQCDTTGKDYQGGFTVFMRADSWHWVKPEPMKGFQGFRYFDGTGRPIVGGWKDEMPDPKKWEWNDGYID